MIVKSPITAVAVVLLSASACYAFQAGDPSDKFLNLLRQYRLPRTLHCATATTIEFKTVPPGIFRVKGTQEYWTDGNRYRILQLLNTPMFPGMSHDVRWDGERFQWFNVTDSTLIFSQNPKQKTPYLSEPVPLLPLAFLNPAGQDLGVRLSLADLRADAERDRLPKAHFVGVDASEVEFPGGMIGKTEFSYRIDFVGSPSYLPTKIRRISLDGVELSKAELSYQPVQCASGVVYLPRWAKLTSRTADNRVFMVATCVVTSIDADAQIAPETFTLDFQTAKSVINMDRYRRPPSGEWNPENPSASAGQSPSQTGARDVSFSVNTALITPAPKSDGDNSQRPVTNLALLLGGIIALGIGCAISLWTKHSRGEAR